MLRVGLVGWRRSVAGGWCCRGYRSIGGGGTRSNYVSVNSLENAVRKEVQYLQDQEDIRKLSEERSGNLMDKDATMRMLEYVKDTRREMISQKELFSLGLSLAAQGNIEAFPELFQGMRNRGIQPGPTQYVSFIRACLSAGAPAEVISVWTDFQKTGQSPDALMIETLMMVFGAAHDLEGLKKVISYADQYGVKWSTRLCNSRLRACSYMDAFDYTALVQEMGKLQRHGFEPDSETYSILIETCIKRGFISKAKELVTEQRSRGMKMTTYSYNALVKYYTVHDRFDLVDQVVQEMLQDGLKPGSPIYCTVISRHARNGNLVKALDMFRAMQRFVKMTKVEYTVLLNIAGRLGNIDLFKGIIAEIEAQGIKLDSFMYCTIITTFAKRRKIDLALGLFEEMKSKKMGDTAAFNAMIDSLLTQAVPDFNQAKRVFLEMPQSGVPRDEGTYGSFLHYFSNIGDVESAREVFADYEKEIGNPSVILYTQYIRALTKGEQHTQAVACWERMRRKGIKPNLISYAVAVTAHCKANDIEEANNLFGEILSSGLTPTPATFHALMLAESRIGNIDAMMKLFQKARELKLEVTPHIYSTMLHGLLKLGDLGEILELIRTMGTDGLLPPEWALNGLLKRLAFDSDYENMLKIMDMMVRRRISMNNSIDHAMNLIHFEIRQNKELFAQFNSKIQRLCANDEKKPLSQRWAKNMQDTFLEPDGLS